MALFGFGRKKKDAAPCCTSCGEACAAHEGEKAMLLDPNARLASTGYFEA